MLEAVDRYFGVTAAGSSLRTEAAAGLTTFLTASYVLFVHPALLAPTGMDRAALVAITALVTGGGTLLMGLWARAPIMMAPGMGLNAFFAITLCGEQGLTWPTALGVVFLSGVLFLVLTVVGARERVLDAIPASLRAGTSVGIGLFLAFIGLRNLGLVQDHPATLVTLAPLTGPVLLGLGGLALSAALAARRVPAALLVGILAVAGLAMALGYAPVPDLGATTWPDLSLLVLKLDVLGALKPALLAPVFAFLYVDLFDSLGTLFAVCRQAGLVEDGGRVKGIGRMLTADAVATVGGALMGTSTTTSYIESAAGVGVGGRTGLTAVVTATLFLLALPLSSLAAAVPVLATAPALVIVGASMLVGLRDVDLGRVDQALPAFVTLLLMPLTYSIATGLLFGFLTHVVLVVAQGRAREVGLVMWVIAGLSALNLVLGA